MPPSSGCVAAAASRLSTAPTLLCSGDPAPSLSGSGRGTRWSPSAASRPALKQKPHLAVRNAAADRRASAQAVPPPQGGSHFQTRWFLTFSSGAATRWSWNCFPTRQGGFCTPGTSGAFTASTDAAPVLSMGTATEVRPLTSSPSSRGQSSGEPCGELPTPLVDGQTSWVYPIHHVQYSKKCQ
jgi:hypothetical protein